MTKVATKKSGKIAHDWNSGIIGIVETITSSVCPSRYTSLPFMERVTWISENSPSWMPVLLCQNRL
ncbi:MAG: hypothetical protein ACFFAJ_17830 [Candidatus Hodarchaeota archaeon]